MTTLDRWQRVGPFCAAAILVLSVAGCRPSSTPSEEDRKPEVPVKSPAAPASPSEPAKQAEPVADVPAAASPAPGKASEPTIDPAIETALRTIAREYTSWQRVSDAANWAPRLCEAPTPPSGVLVSQSSDPDTHDRKLYFLYAKDGPAYSRLSYPPDGSATATSPLGQVLVKESWIPVEVDPATVPRNTEARVGERLHPETYAFATSGKAFQAGKQGPLFIMYKVDPATPDTDEGWVYATMTADKTQVTSAGRVASCMECHTQTPKDRLFGFRPRTPVHSRP